MKSHSDQIFEAIGRAVVAFEEFTFSLQGEIALILEAHGLKHQKLSGIIVADQTAYPLLTMLQSMLSELSKPERHDSKLISKLFVRGQELIEKRNDIIHSMWLAQFSQANAAGEPAADGYKRTKSKKGANLKKTTHTMQTLGQFEADCVEITGLIHIAIHRCVLPGVPYSDWLRFDDANVVRLRTLTKLQK